MRATLLAAVLLLSGCGDPNTDPRKGEVDLDGFDFKVCAGPDLFVYINVPNHPDERRWVRNSPECEAAR